MSKAIEKPRNGCGLHGALQTVTAIRGAIPIVHANAGCVMQNSLANQSSCQRGRVTGESIPSTTVQERHVIFGGGSRLREQIKNTVKVIDGDLYVVLCSCEAAMVGDDVEAMTREAVEQGVPIVDSLSAGFRGDSYSGYDSVLTDILFDLPKIKKPAEKGTKKLVNIFGILPQKDIFYKGDLAEIKRILAGIGVQAHTFFGVENGVTELQNAPNADLNLVFSDWGKETAGKLKEWYGIESVAFEHVPSGILEVEEFVRILQKKLELEEQKTEAFLQKEKEKFQYYMETIKDSYFQEVVGKRVGIVGAWSGVTQFSSLLKNYLGAEIAFAIVTDTIPEEKKEEATIEKVIDTQDYRTIADHIKKNSVDLLIGSSLEKDIAQKKEIAIWELQYPVYHQAILNKTYAGVEGALRFVEDYITKCKEIREEKEIRLLEFIQKGA
ncbi:MAG: nitrogenase component 1 [Roseburia sp.]